MTQIFKGLGSLIGSRMLQNISLFIFSLIVILLTVFPNGLDSVHFNVSFRDDVADLAKAFGLADPGSYLNAAIELERYGHLTSNQIWVINLWPPGMVWLDALLVGYFGDNFGIAFAILVISIWTMLSGFFAIELKKHFGFLISLISVSFLLLSSPIQMWVLHSGLYYAEGISIAAFFGGLILLIRGSHNDPDTVLVYVRGMVAGIFFAVSAYFRSTFSTLEALLLFLSLFLAATLFFLRKKRKFDGLFTGLKRQFKLLSITWLSMFLLMEPWLQFTQHFVRGFRAWSVVGANFFRNVWAIRSESADFMQAGGIGWGCEIDKVFCQEVNGFETSTGTLYPIQDLIIHAMWTILTHPVQYLEDRLKFLGTGWFSNEASMGTSAIVPGFILLILFIGVLVQTLRLSVNPDFVTAFIFLAAVLVIAPLMIGHVEPRYFIPLKLLFILYPWLLSKKKLQSNQLSF